MPTVFLTRNVIDDIKNQRSEDCLCIALIDPNEHNIPKLTRLLGQALQVTTSLKVLELIQPSPELISLVAHALNRPRCRLQGLKLQGLKKPQLAEITNALSHFLIEHITMTMAGIVGTSCHTLTITLNAQPFAVMQLTALHISQLAVHGLPVLTPLPIKPACGLVLPEAPSMPRRSPVEAAHSLSVSSRWGHGESRLLKECFRSVAPSGIEDLEGANKVSLFRPGTVLNTHLNPQLPASQMTLAPVAEEKQFSAMPALKLCDTLSYKVGQEDSRDYSAEQWIMMSNVKHGAAKSVGEGEEHASLIEGLLSDGMDRSLTKNLLKRSSSLPHVSAASYAVGERFCLPPVVAFTGVATIGPRITGQLAILTASTAECTLKHSS